MKRLIYIAMLLVPALAHGASDASLYGYWSMNEGTSTSAFDYSGNGRTGTVVGATWGQGRADGGLTLDGNDDYVQVSDTLSSIGTGSFTSSAWFRTPTGGNTWKRVMHTGCNGYSAGMFMARWNATNQLAGAVCVGSTAASSFVPVTTQSFIDGNWHHMALVVDRAAGTARIYVDGRNVTIQKNSASECGTLSGDSLSLDISACTTATVAGGNLRFGVNSSTAEDLDGQVDEARIWSRALSATEISSLYRAGLSKVTAYPTRGLAARWTLNEPGNLFFDSSGNRNTGTGVNSPSSVTARVGSGLSFSGSNGVTVATSSGTSISQISSAVSVSTWVRRGDDGNFRNIAGVMKNDSTTSFAWGFRANNGNQVFFDFFVGGVRRQANDSATIPVGQWVHYLFAWDGTNYTLYRNGTSVNTGTISGTLDPFSNKEFEISGSGGYNRFLGAIDEVAVWNRALSQAEAVQVYRSGLSRVSAAPSSSELRAYLSMNEGTSTTAYDYSGTGNAGTLVSGPAWVQGRSDGGLFFDGTNDTVSIPHSASMKPATTMTMSAWVRPDAGSLSSIREIYRKDDGSQRHLFAFQTPAFQCSSGVATDVCISFGINSGTYTEFDVPIVASEWEGKWRLVTAVYDGSARRMYFDGVLASSTPFTGAIATGGTATGYIGSLSGTSEFFKGSIDEFRLWGRALSASEVAALYRAGVGRVNR